MYHVGLSSCYIRLSLVELVGAVCVFSVVPA